MDRKTNLIPALLLSALSLYAMEDVKVTQFQHAGPFTVNKPILADSLNVNGKPFEAKNLLKATLPFEQTLANATVLDADTAGAITFAAPIIVRLLAIRQTRESGIPSDRYAPVIYKFR